MNIQQILAATIFAVVLVLTAATGATSVSAQQPTTTSPDPLAGIIQDVIGLAIEAASEEVRRNTGIDPLQRGYDRQRNSGPAPTNATQETRRELRKLNAKHDRRIAKLEEELRRKLDKAEAEFEREAAKDGKPKKIGKKRDKLQEKVDKAYANFEKKIAKANRNYDEKRDKILGRNPGG